MCFVDMEKAFDRVPGKVIGWAIKKKNLSEAMFGVVTSLYNGTKDKSEDGICIFKEIQSKGWCTSGICAAANIVCNSCAHY